MKIELAPDIHQHLQQIVAHAPFDHVNISRIVCMRSTEATSRARARIWSFPRIWQMALNLEPHYVIEVLSQHFDHLSEDDRTRVLIHELMHIPKNFSGSLIPHKTVHARINSRTVEKIFLQYKKNRF